MSTSVDALGGRAVPISIDPRSRAIALDGPTIPARAHEAEADTTEPVAAKLGHEGPHGDRDDAASMEHERLARLRR